MLTHAWFLGQRSAGKEGRAKADEGRAAAGRPPDGRAAAGRPLDGRAAAERPPGGRAAAERRAVSSAGERAATDEPAARRADEGTHSTGAVTEATASRTANLQDRRAIPPLRSAASLERDCSPQPGHRAALPRTLSGRREGRVFPLPQARSL